jgi:energy-coupling factor transporter ATP-binding protein EcfA2
MIEALDIQHRILKIPTLGIQRGATAVIGPNGSGKTTFLQLCTGITTPEKGVIRVDGRHPREIEVGWVGEFPDRNMLLDLVFHEIASPLRFAHLPCRDIEDQVRRVAEEIGIHRLLHRSQKVLSGGEKALVACATALVARPHLLVLDEIDTHLDRESWLAVDEAIRRRRIPYLLLSTQDMEIASRMDHLLYMEVGEVRDEGAPEEVFPRREQSCFYPPMWRLKR